MRSTALSPPRPPAGRTRPPARNGFRFLRLHGRWAGSDRCGGAPSIPAHRAIIIARRLTCLVCLVQVYGVGGGELRRMPDLRGDSGAEMQGWPAVDGLLSVGVGMAEVVGTLGLRLECRSGGGWWLSGRKLRLAVGEWRPAGARAVGGCWWRVGWAAPCVPAGSRQAVENAGLWLLWGWAKRGCVCVERVALVGVLVGSAASQRRIAIVMYGLSCGMLPATTHPSHTPLSLALFVSSGRSLETRAHPLFGR